MHGSDALTPTVEYGLTVFYLFAALLNLGFAAYQFYGKRDRRQTVVWATVAGVFLLHALIYLVGVQMVLPHSIRDFTTWLMGLYNGQAGPILYTPLSVIGFVALLYWRKFFTRPVVAWTILNLSLLFFGWSLTDPNFREIVAKADNVPITM